MPYSRPFIKVRINGDFGSSASSPVEQWSTGVNISSVGGGDVTPPSLLQFLTLIATPVSTFFASSALKAGPQCFLKELTCAYIGVDGLYVLGALQPTTRYTYATPVAGQGSTTQNNTVALVLSLRSLRLRGPASHGRMYWPATAQSPSNADGTLSTGATTAVATAGKTLIDAINLQATTRFGAGSLVSLVSRVGSGQEAVVTQVKVDQKLDHMESRERSVVSVYATGTLAAATAVTAQRDQQLRDLYDDLDDPTP